MLQHSFRDPDRLEAELEFAARDRIQWESRVAPEGFALHYYPTTSSPLILADDILIASLWKAGRIVALSALDGKPLWSHVLGSYAGTRLVLTDRRLFVASCRTLVALDLATGREQWSYEPSREAGERVYSSPAVSEGRVFISDRDGWLHCLERPTASWFGSLVAVL
jgi:outer membrane protein assembly factor BamB